MLPAALLDSTIHVYHNLVEISPVFMYITALNKYYASIHSLKSKKNVIFSSSFHIFLIRLWFKCHKKICQIALKFTFCHSHHSLKQNKKICTHFTFYIIMKNKNAITCNHYFWYKSYNCLKPPPKTKKPTPPPPNSSSFQRSDPKYKHKMKTEI